MKKIDKVKKSYNELKSLKNKALKEFKNKSTRKRQIPNILTASRLFSPIFIIPSALSGNLILTAIFTIMFALTDAFDGYLARKLNCSSEFGRRLDAITDKVFAGSLLIPITILYPLTLIVFILALVIAFINIDSQIENKDPKTNFIGKIKTCLLYPTIILAYLNTIVSINTIFLNSFILITVILQVLASIKYYTDYKKR